MFETPGRKFFRSPFPLGKLLQNADPSFEGIQSSPSNDNPIIHIVTRKNPTVPLVSPTTSSIVDAETRKNPTAPLVPPNIALVQPAMAVPERRRITVPLQPPATAPARRAITIPLQPPSTFSGQAPYSTNAVPQKHKRTRVSPRKKKLLIILLVASLLPTFIVVFEIINGLVLYKQVQGGFEHLQSLQTIFHGNSDTNKYFDQKKLIQAQGEIEAAHADFVSLSNTADNDGTISLSSSFLPAQISTIRALSHIAVDGTIVASQFIKIAMDIAPTVVPALKQSASHTQIGPIKPFITSKSFQEINNTLDTITPLIHDMSIHEKGLHLDALPISTKQRQLLTSILPLLPILDANLAQKQQWISVVGWFLGVSSPRSFLIEPMDSAELRATGGFTGQFGELNLNGGHMGPLKLSNIGKYEEDHSNVGSPPDPIVYAKVSGQTAPDPYSSWWPVGNFGLRDANLSADFPTSAKIAMNRYEYEFGNHVDGVIIFTPVLIQQILHVTGPITIPIYGETITDQNLQARLHFYQLDNRGILREKIIEKVNDPELARKLFTQRVTSALISTVTHLSIDKLLPMANEMLQSMKSKDLQIYVTNTQLEALIGKYGSTASMDRSTTHDGLFIVQSNVSASKASQYVKTSIKDTIALDSQGGATHNLQMTLDYQQKGDVYGLDTYRDYVRIYTPTSSQFIVGNGFDQYDKPYCGDAQSGRALCQPDVYGDRSLVCTPPISIGYATSYVSGVDPYANTDHPLDQIGIPTNIQNSDEAGRNMFGGWIIVPKNCIMKITLSWYVPSISRQAYSLLLQAQASVYAPLDLTIQPISAKCGASKKNSLHFASTMNGADINFTVKQQGAQCSLITR